MDATHEASLEEDALLSDLMVAIDAPEGYTTDDLTKGIEHVMMRRDTIARTRAYVNVIIHKPLLSYALIRKALGIFAQSCNPPLTIEQARAAAYIEKMKRAQQKDPAALLSLSKHEPRSWNLPHPIEVFLWSWLADMWPTHKKVAMDRKDLQQEIMKLSKLLEVSTSKILEWIRGTFTAMVKMQEGKVNTKGWTVQLVVRAAIDDTPP